MPNNEAFLAYMRFEKDQLIEEMLAIKLITDTMANQFLTWYKNDEKSATKRIFHYISCCATVNASSMTGRYKGFFEFFKKCVPDLFTIHYIIYQQQSMPKFL